MTLKFSDFINEKYEDWRRKQSQGERTLTLFAKWLGVPLSTVSTWGSGGYPPSDEATIGKLASKLGKEVYEILGIDDPFHIETKNYIEKYKDDEVIYNLMKKIHNAGTKLEEQFRKKKP